MYVGKRILILGLARQGVALARYLAEQGARVVVNDQQSAEKLAANIVALAGLPIEYVLGGHPLSVLDGVDLVCLSGGVDAHGPLPVAARERSIPLSNDTQIFLEHCQTHNTVGITGSAGKTTTTTLVGRMLSASDEGRGKREEGHIPPASSSLLPQVWVGGNIGNPLIGEASHIGVADTVVLELSSFQLEIVTRSVRVAAILNITPNHLDRHGTMEAYTDAKANLLRYQSPDSVAILSADNALTRDLVSFVKGRQVWFSGEQAVAEGTFLRGETLVWRWAGREHAICTVADIELRGQHNVLNVLAACAISGAAGATVEQMRAGLRGFTGVEHRLELVRERNGVRWYNDSIASAPERVIAALHSFTEPIVLLAGGRDKKLPWAEFAELAKQRVKHIVLFGEAAGLIEAALRAADYPASRHTRCDLLFDAVQVADQHATRGDVVLLSPGCTSFDAFKDFAERGEQFKQWVRALD